MNQWIDEKIGYLDSRIGRVPPKDFLFDPTKEFYEKLERIEVISPIEVVLENIDRGKLPFVTFDVATDEIAKHLGRSIPIIEFHPFRHNVNEPHIAGKIQVGGSVREIQISSNYKKKAMQLGTILAHEIAHDVLYSKGIILPDTQENEKLTDLTAVMLGLGKLFLNGMEERSGIMATKLCYLSFSDIAYAYVRINSIYEVPRKNYFINLTNSACSKVKPFFDKIDVKNARAVMKDIKKNCSEVQSIRDRVEKVYYQIRDNQELINENADSIKNEPEDGEMFVYLNSYEFQQKFERIIPHVDQKIGDVNKKLASEWKHTSVDTIPDTMQCFRKLDILITQIKKEVEQYLEKLVESLSVQEKYFPKRSDIVIERFKELIKEGKIKKAIRLSVKEDCKLLNNLGIEFAKKKDPLALEIFGRIIKLDPNNALAHYNRGNTYRDLNQQSMAIDDYNEAIILNPGYVGAYINRGNIYFRWKQYSEAIDDYTEAIRLNSSYMTYLNRGNAHVSLKQYLEAIDDFQMALKLKPYDYMARDNLKNAFSLLKEQEGVIIYAKTKIKSFSCNVLNWIKRT